MSTVKRKRKHPVRRIILIILLLALLGGIGYLVWGNLKAEYTIVYDSYNTSVGSISNALSFSGTLQAVNNSTYTAGMEATVRQVYVAEGDDVKKGDKLVRLSDGETFEAEFDGRVNQLPVAKDDKVRAGDTVVQVCDFSSLRSSFRVDEYDIADVHVGDECRVTVTANDHVFTSKIKSINYVSASQGNVAYYTTTVDVDATGVSDVYPGMQVTVTVPQQEASDVVILKVDALSFDEKNQAFVYLQGEDGKMTEQPVTVGVSNGNYAEIKEGLTADQTVYVESKQKAEATGLAALMQGAFQSTQVNNRNNRNNNRNQNWQGGGNFDPSNMPSMPSGGGMPGGGSQGGNGGNR